MTRYFSFRLEQLFAGMNQIPHDRHEQSIHLAARGGRMHALGATFEKLLTDFVFQFGDLHAQCRLNNVQPFCGARCRSFFKKADEILYLSKFHFRSPDLSTILMPGIACCYLFDRITVVINRHWLYS